MFRFEHLQIWQEAIDYVAEIFEIASSLPKETQYNVGSQIRSAVLSISNNIAEGSGSFSARDFKVFLNYSVRSVFETVSILIVCKRKGWIDEKCFKDVYEKGEKLARKITNFRKSL